MATRHNDERDFVTLNHIIAVAQEHKPSENVILKDSLSTQLERLIQSERKSGILFAEALREFKKKFVIHVLEQNGWNQCRAARELGMHRNTLSRTCAELGIDVRHEYLLLGAERRRGRKKAARRAGIMPGHEHKSIERGS